MEGPQQLQKLLLLWENPALDLEAPPWGSCKLFLLGLVPIKEMLKARPQQRMVTQILASLERQAA